MPLSGLAVAEIGIGGIVLWSGIKGYSLADTFSNLATGKTPQETEPITTDAVVSPASGSPSGDTGAANATASQNQAAAKRILTQMGLSSWTTGPEWEDLVSLWNQESGWNSNAQNPTSTAYGIAQFLDTTWAGFGPKTSDPATQIQYGIEYIQQRYGSPILAWAHETANNWY